MNLKPQDVVVLLKLVAQGQLSSYSALASQLSMSASEVHAGMRRATESGLLDPVSKMPIRAALQEFLLHGLCFVYPPPSVAPLLEAFSLAMRYRRCQDIFRSPPLSHHRSGPIQKAARRGMRYLLSIHRCPKLPAKICCCMNSWRWSMQFAKVVPASAHWLASNSKPFWKTLMI